MPGLVITCGQHANETSGVVGALRAAHALNATRRALRACTAREPGRRRAASPPARQLSDAPVACGPLHLARRRPRSPHAAAVRREGRPARRGRTHRRAAALPFTLVTEFPDETIEGDAFRLAHTTQTCAVELAAELYWDGPSGSFREKLFGAARLPDGHVATRYRW
ncbi:hypothetical protein [Burkholderia ambifaria]|uniref:hypothetical protein n=1 Tax=Burkholderia ambifaria TaxID=152480 RepID=UPI001588931D|nr:hypothetical protein [Burkholderia ambifaria]